MPSDISALIASFNTALKSARSLSSKIRSIDRSHLLLSELYDSESSVPLLKGKLSTDNCSIYGNRRDLISSFKDLDIRRICEVGVLNGTFSKFAMETLEDFEIYYLVDRSFDKITADLDNYNSKIVKLEGDSSMVMDKGIPNASLDLIYIDGDHSYKGVAKDTEVALRKIKKGGFIIFNDYSCFNQACITPYGVLKCVHELLASHPKSRIVSLSLSPVDLKDICIKVL